jgi:phospholipid/cholesterol/gamma-HCH transport system substrate-binding protein
MADKFDSVLTAVQGFTGDKENQGFMANASAAAKSVRELADSLSKSAPPALREYHALAVDARRTVGEIERVVRNLERNPGQFLFGGGASSSGGVPEYNPR